MCCGANARSCDRYSEDAVYRYHFTTRCLLCKLYQSHLHYNTNQGGIVHWKKMVLSGCIGLFCAIAAFSAPCLVVHKSDGTTEKIPIAEINKITFNLTESSVNQSQMSRDVKKFTSAIKTGFFGADIEYSLKKECAVHIKIFDLKGMIVRTLITATQPAGTHKISWDYRHQNGKKVATGSYIAKVIIDGVPRSKCLYLVR